MRYILPSILSLSLIVAACSPKNGDASDSASQSAPFTRLDRLVEQFPSMTAQRQHVVVDSLAIPLYDYIYLMGASTGNIPASIDSLSHTAAFTMFGPEVEKAYPSTSDIEKRLGALNANMRRLTPALPSYSYYGIISPYRQQVMLVDSVVYVALNHYLGATHDAYSTMPEYARFTKTAEYIPLDIAEAVLSVEYPFKVESAPTAIQYFIYEGALLKAVSALTGINDTATLMGWTPAQLDKAQTLEAEAWRKMATDNIIYSTDMALAQRLCAPSPASQPLSAEIPGRFGRYVGYRIVNSYLEKNPDTALTDILSPQFYNNPLTLINSGYAPAR